MALNTKFILAEWLLFFLPLSQFAKLQHELPKKKQQLYQQENFKMCWKSHLNERLKLISKSCNRTQSKNDPGLETVLGNGSVWNAKLLIHKAGYVCEAISKVTYTPEEATKLILLLKHALHVSVNCSFQIFTSVLSEFLKKIKMIWLIHSEIPLDIITTSFSLLRWQCWILWPLWYLWLTSSQLHSLDIRLDGWINFCVFFFLSSSLMCYLKFLVITKLFLWRKREGWILSTQNSYIKISIPST